MRYTNEGQIQRYLCRDCGYRFSQSCVKLNIAGKVRESSNSGKNHHEMGVASGDAINEKVDDCLPFAYSEDVAPHTLSITEKSLNSLPFYNRNIQVCAQKDAKNLNPTTETKTVAGDRKTTLDKQTLKGKLLEFEFWLNKQGYDEKGCKNRAFLMKRLSNLGAVLNDTETIKKVLA